MGMRPEGPTPTPSDSYAPEIEPWRLVWRQGISPFLHTDGLVQLLMALETDSPELIQGETVAPPTRAIGMMPLGACAVAYVRWKYRVDAVDEKPTTCNQLHSHLEDVQEWTNQRMGRLNAFRDFTRWYDYGQRKETFAALAEEVRLTLSDRTTS